MTYEPEIIISSEQSVFQEMHRLIAQFKSVSSQSDCGDVLDIVEAYAQSIIDIDIHPIVNEMARFSGYDALNAWITDSDDLVNGASDSIPHRDYPCIGVFFYFNEVADMNTSCIPNAYSGEPTDAILSYEGADKARSISLPAQSVAIIKLHETTHFAPDSIPEGETRVVMNARYNY